MSFGFKDPDPRVRVCIYCNIMSFVMGIYAVACVCVWMPLSWNNGHVFSTSSSDLSQGEPERGQKHQQHPHSSHGAKNTNKNMLQNCTELCIHSHLDELHINDFFFAFRDKRKLGAPANWSSLCYVHAATAGGGKIAFIYIDKQRNKVLLKLVHCPVRTSNNKDFFFRYRALKKTWQHRKSYKYLTSETDDIRVYVYKRKLKHEYKFSKRYLFSWLFFLFCFSPFEHLHLAKNIYVNRASSKSKAHT